MTSRMETQSADDFPRRCGGELQHVFPLLLAIGCSITMTGLRHPSACARCCAAVTNPLQSRSPLPGAVSAAMPSWRPHAVHDPLIHPMDDGIAFRSQLVQHTRPVWDALAVLR
jgi:hypothetical protein